jgi:hypothetical protein
VEVVVNIAAENSAGWMAQTYPAAVMAADAVTYM